MDRRSFLKKLVLGAGAVAIVAALPKSAQAAGCQTETAANDIPAPGASETQMRRRVRRRRVSRRRCVWRRTRRGRRVRVCRFW